MANKIIHPNKINKDLVLEKIEFYRDVSIWPDETVIDCEGWLSNFKEDEIPFAVSLLNSFTYLSSKMVDALLSSAFIDLSNFILKRNSQIENWNDFISNSYITNVEGEKGRISGSGYIYTRKARTKLGYDEDHILTPKKALEKLMVDEKSSIIFVDDFSGSGNQFMATWEHEYDFGERVSFSNFTEGNRCYFCPIICTTKAQENISKNAQVKIFPAHILNSTYNAFSDNSEIWPSELKPRAEEFIYNTSVRAGILNDPDVNWKGFHGLGLSIGIDDTVPDASLPIYYWEKGWRPLMRRR